MTIEEKLEQLRPEGGDVGRSNYWRFRTEFYLAESYHTAVRGIKDGNPTWHSMAEEALGTARRQQDRGRTK